MCFTGASPVQTTREVAASVTATWPVKDPGTRRLATQPVEAPGAGTATQSVEAPGAGPNILPAGVSGAPHQLKDNYWCV